MTAQNTFQPSINLRRISSSLCESLRDLSRAQEVGRIAGLTQLLFSLCYPANPLGPFNLALFSSNQRLLPILDFKP